MPRAALYALRWSVERATYELFEQGQPAPLTIAPDGAWFAWLDAHNAFAFEGRTGSANILKEARAGDERYWYAYRRQGKRTAKRYVGRSAALTFAHLEAIAATLNATQPNTSVMPNAMGVPQKSPTQAFEAAQSAYTSDTASVFRMPATRPQGPLLEPKLQLPRLSTSLIVRERLFAQLGNGHERKLTVISAPAGCGKTTLALQWLEQARGAPEVAWVSLDVGDNDPMRFWRYVITACQVVQSDLGYGALTLLAAASQPPFEALSQEMLLTPFLNDLARRSQPITLVLDDYHLISDAQIHLGLTFLLDHLPTAAHLVMLTRSEPPVSLARLRASGAMRVLHAGDLRFSTEETYRFLGQIVPTPLPPEALAQVDAQLEGWAAGLRLLALALQGRESLPDVVRVLATFAGSNRSVLDYFIAEVLDALPPAQQRFLLLTSILDRITGDLCDAILDVDQDTSGAILESLERANLFLEPLDGAGGWYRYHALFADAMRFEARRRLGEPMLRAISARASVWYEHHGLHLEAVETALQAREPLRAAILIEQVVENKQFDLAAQLFYEAAETRTLRRWLEQLPADVMQQHPNLCLSYAITLLVTFTTASVPQGSDKAVETALHTAEQGFRASGNTPKLGEVFGFRSILAKQLGDIGLAVQYARQSLAALPAEELAWRSASLSSIGTGEHFAGRLAIARSLLLEARVICESLSNWGFSRAIIGMLSGVYIEQGECSSAVTFLRQMLVEARDQGDHDDVAHALIGLMQVSYERNTLDLAEQQAREAYEVGKQINDHEFQAQTRLMLARIEHARGQTTAAQQRVAQLVAWLQPQQSQRMRWHYRAARAFEARLALATGDIAIAQAWHNDRAHYADSLSALQEGREELVVARLLLAGGDSDAALALLSGLLAMAQREGQIYYGLEIRVLVARVYVARNQLPEARQHIELALAAAATYGCVRLFLDEGDALAPIVRSMLPQLRERPIATYARALLRAFGANSGTHTTPGDTSAQQVTLAEPLSQQEQRVLQLLAAGHSNPAIAAQLVISVNTVKAHLKHIYRKLHVSNRVEAGAAAVHVFPVAPLP